MTCVARGMGCDGLMSRTLTGYRQPSSISSANRWPCREAAALEGVLLLSSRREEVVRILRAKGLRRLDERIRLASGAWSRDFVDGKEALAEWRDLRTACEVIVETVTGDGHHFDAVGGLTMGADALAVGIAAVSDRRWFFVRKEPKQRGTNRWVEGARIGSGDRILLVDDIVTTGGSILTALDVIGRTGACTVAAATLVDRGDMARPRFEQQGIAYYPVTTYESLGIDPVEFHQPTGDR